MARKNLIDKDMAKYKSAVLMVHHLFMLSMENDVFPKNYDPNFDYENFLDNEQFKEHDKFNQMNANSLKMLNRF